jgi:tRNA pseudouridine55 synthase
VELFNENTTDFQEGVLIPVNKPLDWTSFDVVNKIRRLLKRQYNYQKIKVGHAGTLDPAASGVLLVCTGKATKQINELQGQIKTYSAILKLGEITPSYDRETEVTEHFPTEHINQSLIEKTLKEYTGEIMQVPPAYSAVHINGKRAYQLARKGETPNLQARKVKIDSINFLNREENFIHLEIVCHAGTYIRSLARDIGDAMNSGAWLYALERTKIGNVGINECFDMEKIEKIIKK